jgi:TRAP-type C4-dicarboxylate transport system permease small subunit
VLWKFPGTLVLLQKVEGEVNSLEKINSFLNRILMIVGSVAVLLLMSIATVNAFLRIPLFKASWRGAYEVVGFLGAIVIAFALGYTQKRKDHIVVDILTERFPKKVNRVLDGINYFVTTIFFALVSWQVLVWGVKISQSGEVSETLKIIFHPFIYSVALGFAVFSFTLAIDFLKNFKSTEE